MMTYNRFCSLFFTMLAIALCATSVQAEITVAKVFGDNMVLQRGEPIKIWGWGTPGEQLSCTFANQELSASVGEDGTWELTFPTMQAGGPYTMAISGESSVQYENIMIGDVWVCSGQSNMEWRVYQTQFQEKDLEFIDKNMVRMLTVQIGWDCLPAQDINGGEWQNLSKDNIQFFSAVAYHFGKSLNKELDVPIGLINSSLGATAIEAWMSNDALMEFDQFQPAIEPVLEHGMNHADMESTFEKTRNAWERDHYLKGPGIEGKWHLPSTDRSDWGTIEVPAYWDSYGLASHDGAVWYSKEFDLPANFNGASFLLQLNQIRDYDITWINGVKIGETYGRRQHRNYYVDTSILKQEGNLLVVRAFDDGGRGGFTTAAFWGNQILLGEWKYKKGLEIDASKFPKVIMPNMSPFSSPAGLFNSNIAPLTGLPIKGAIWYQGEANVFRAEEYRELLPAMINDWRKQWGNREFPFLIVQLANHLQADMLPAESSWAELREAQYKALKLPNTGLACTIDIGEANDIHPKNKEDVGKRLALSALKVAYGQDVVHSGPEMHAINYYKDRIEVYYKNTGDGLVSSRPGKTIGGFAIAMREGEYAWVDAQIKNESTVVIPNVDGTKTKFIRYAWSDNPSQVSLYNSEGLPALPFRTDTFEGVTHGAKYNFEDDQF